MMKTWTLLLVTALVLASFDFARPAFAQHPGESWQSLNAEMKRHYEAGDPKTAAEVGTKALALAKKELGPDHADVGWITLNLAGMHQGLGDDALAEALYRRALEILEVAVGSEHPGVGVAMNNLAWLYYGQENYAAAEPLYERTLELNSQLHEPDHPTVVMIKTNLADVYFARARYDAAAPLYEELLEIERAAHPDNDPTVLRIMTKLARVAFARRNYLRATDMYRHLLSADEERLGSDHPDLVSSLASLAATYSAQGIYVAATPLYRRMLAITEKTLGSKHPDTQENAYKLARNYRDRGLFVAAEPLFQQVVAIDEETHGAESEYVASSLMHLAFLYLDLGKYSAAEPLFRRSLEITENIAGPEHPDVAASLNNLAAVHFRRGDFAWAGQLLERSLVIVTKAWGPDHPDVAQCMRNLADLYFFQHRIDAALALYERVLATVERTRGADHPEVASTLIGYAHLHLEQSDVSAAVAMYDRALAIRERSLGPDHPSVASTLEKLARIDKSQGRLSEALSRYERSLAIKEKTLGPDHPEVAVSMIRMAELHRLEGRNDLAGPLYERTVAIKRQQLDNYFASMSDRRRQAFVASLDGGLSSFYSFHVDIAVSSPESPREILDTALWSKGVILSRQASERQAMLAAGDTEVLERYDELIDVRQQLANLVYRQQSFESYPRELVSRLKGEADRLEEQLARFSSTYAGVLERRQSVWTDIRAALDQGDAAIQFLQFPYHDGEQWQGIRLIALVVQHGCQSPALVDLGFRDDLSSALDAYRVSVKMEDRPMMGSLSPAKGLSALHRAVWSPLEPLLKGCRRLFVCPDGELNLVNLGLLVDESGAYLMDRYDLHLVSHFRDLLEVGRDYGHRRALLVGDPDYGLGISERQNAVAAMPDAGEAVVSRSLDPVRGEFGSWKRLPETAKEVQSIAGLLDDQGWTSQTATTTSALEEVVKRSAEGCRLLHLATHGYFLADLEPEAEIQSSFGRDAVFDLRRDPLLRSGVVLAGALRSDRTEGIDDGYLTASEAQYLDLSDTELVVLSACETGLGAVSFGEGVYGLRRSLKVAGAGGVLMSLWKVPDQQTRELMERFYGHWLGGDSPRVSLHKAQTELRILVIQERKMDLPMYWGAFVYVGD